VEGTVFVNYTIDQKGDVIEVKVISGIGHGCDEEAIRLAKLLKFIVPKTRGLRVLFHQNLQIHFRLPKQKTPRQQPVQIQYNYVPEAKKETPAEPHQGSGGYTITIPVY
jgi:protein TonB